MKKIKKMFFGTNFRRYMFYSYLCYFNLLLFMFSAIYFKLTFADMYLITSSFTGPVAFIFGYFADKYFRKCYQFKKNYNKELINEKKDD